MSVESDNFQKAIATNAIAMNITAQIRDGIELAENVYIYVQANYPSEIDVTINYSYGDDDDDNGAVLKTITAIRKLLGGKWDKDTSYNQFQLTRDLGDGLILIVGAPRKLVCERRVVGTETVTRQVPVEYEEQQVEEEIVEWDCPKSLLG